MHSKRYIAAAAALLAACVCAHSVAQSYPSKPIRLIAPFPPGGGVDAAARIISQALTESLGQQVIVDNRGGASGRIGTELAAKAPADGYNLLLGSVGPNAIIPGASPRLSYDGMKNFAPISVVAESDYVLTVHPSLPVRSVKDLVALARSRPAQIAFGSTGNLSGPHLAGELFKQLAKVDMMHVPYKGGAAATTAILGGEIPLMYGSAPTVIPHARAGRLTMIATTGSRRSKTLPELPTSAETLRGHEVTQWYGVLAPAGTPADIISRLSSEIAKATRNPKIIQQFAASGADATSNSPEQFAAHIKAEIEKWGKVVKTSGVPLE